MFPYVTWELPACELSCEMRTPNGPYVTMFSCAVNGPGTSRLRWTEPSGFRSVIVYTIRFPYWPGSLRPTMNALSCFFGLDDPDCVWGTNGRNRANSSWFSLGSFI